jgi:hypothetical protein
MTQAVSHRSLTSEARVRAPVSPGGILVDKVAPGQVFVRVLRFTLLVSFHRGGPYSYITWGVNDRPAGGRSSETVSPYRHEHVYIHIYIRTRGSKK